MSYKSSYNYTSLSANYPLILPESQGSANQVMKNDGEGNLFWQNDASGTGDFKGPASSTADNIITFLDGTGKEGKDSNISAKSNLSYSTYLATDKTPSSSDFNTWIGKSVGSNSATGLGNLIVGASTALNLTSAQQNVILGAASSSAINSSSFNFIGGYNSAPSLTSGSANVVLGHGALGGTTTNNSVAIGYSALSGQTGALAGGCVGVGYAAGASATTLFNNTFLGNGADTSLPNVQNSTAIGANAIVDKSNQIMLGTNGVTEIVNESVIGGCALGSTTNRWGDFYSAGNSFLASSTTLTKLQEYNFFTEHALTFRLPEQIVIIGDVLFFMALADNAQDGIISVDISKPNNMKMLDTYFTGSTAFNFCIIGKYAYLEGAINALDIVDISRPDNLTAVATSYNVGVGVDRVFGKNNKLFTSDATNLYIFSLQNPIAPSLETTIAHGGVAYNDIDTNDTYLYGARSDGGIDIIDLISNTVVESDFALDGVNNVTNVILQGTILYAYIGNTGLYVIDVSTPSTPLLLDSVSIVGTTANQASHLSVQGNYVYVHDTGSNDIHILDATNKSALVDATETVSITTGALGALNVQGDVIYCLTTNGPTTDQMSISSFQLKSVQARSCNIGSIICGENQVKRNCVVEGEIVCGKGITCNDGINVGSDSIISGALSISEGLHITTGANKTIGQATLVNGTVNVATTAVTANSLIFLTYASVPPISVGLAPTLYSANLVVGSDFNIKSTWGTGDNADVNWWIIN